MTPGQGQSRDSYLQEIDRHDAEVHRERVARIMAIDPNVMVVSPRPEYGEFTVSQRLQFKPKD